jgi:tRNA pseudouridine(38-40) synthase
MLTRQWRRYVFAVQYHGGNALGFSYQGIKGENCIVYKPRSKDTRIEVDLRGVESIEGRIRRALNCLVGSGNYQNIQVSSRTDRGVHAWRNTFQVDLRPRLRKQGNQEEGKTTLHDETFKAEAWTPKNLVHGLNFYLARLPSFLQKEELNGNTQDASSLSNDENTSKPWHCNNTIRILSAGVAPNLRLPNRNYDPNLPQDNNNYRDLPWDVRFTATKRTYAYRILHSFDHSEKYIGSNSDVFSAACYHGYPFEDDRVWRIHEKISKQSPAPSFLDIEAMNLAGKYLSGTHDFTSFRGKGCQRGSPIVTLENISCSAESYHGEFGKCILNAALKNKSSPETLRLVTIIFTGNSFVYHQIRNIVACLVEVGQGKMSPDYVKVILEKKDRSCAVGMAPPQGLFLVDVEHGDFKF